MPGGPEPPLAMNATHPDRNPSLVWRFLRAAGLFAFLFFAAQAAYYSVFIWRQLPRERENCLAESTRVERTLAFAKGESLFGDFSTWPHHEVLAGNLLFVAPGWAMRLQGLPDSMTQQAYLARLLGRAQSLCGFLAILAALFWLGRGLGLRGIWSSLPVLAFFSGRLLYKFAYAFRPDVLMIGLVLWAWWFVLSRRGYRSVLVASVLMVVAFALKPTALASAGALGLWLLLRRDFRRAGAYAGMCALGYPLYVLVLKMLSHGHGGVMVAETLETHLYWRATYEHLLVIWEKPLAMLPLAGGWIATLLFLLRPSLLPEKTSIAPRALALAFVCSFAVTEVFVMRPGSNAYYFLEPYCWGVLLTSLLARRAAAELRQRCLTSDAKALSRQPWAVLWIVLLGLVLTIQLKACRNLWADRAELRRYPTFAQRHPRLVEILRETRGQVLMDDVYPYWYTQADPTLLMSLGYSVYVKAGVFSTEPLEAKIAQQDFGLILLTYDASRGGLKYQDVEVFPAPINRAIADHYDLSDYIEPYYLYRPRQVDRM